MRSDNNRDSRSECRDRRMQRTRTVGRGESRWQHRRLQRHTGQRRTPWPPPAARTRQAPQPAAAAKRPTCLARSDDSRGHDLPVVLDTGVGSRPAASRNRSHAHLSQSITIGGMTALPEGSRVSGVVTAATRAAKVKGSAHVAVRFDSVTPRGDDQRYDIRTAAVGRTAPATKKDDALRSARRPPAARSSAPSSAARRARPSARRSAAARARRRAVDARQGSQHGERRRADAETDRAGHDSDQG